MKKIIFFTCVLIVGSYAGSYNASSAVNYAKKWSKKCSSYGCPQNWNTREFSEYDSYSGGRTDCANFVSQSLFYGGKNYDATNNDDYDPGWYETDHEENIRHADFWFSKNFCSMNGDTDYKDNSIAWVRVSALRTRFAYGYVSGTKITSESRTRAGDIFFP